jgi:hypothetical protein
MRATLPGNPGPYYPAPGEGYKPTTGPEAQAEINRMLDEAKDEYAPLAPKTPHGMRAATIPPSITGFTPSPSAAISSWRQDYLSGHGPKPAEVMHGTGAHQRSKAYSPKTRGSLKNGVPARRSSFS